MPNYKNKQGILYTQEEIEAVALENGVDIEKVITDNELTLEDGGKQKSVVAQEPTTAQKPKEKKPASSTKAPSSASSGKKKYPWAEEKKQPGFLDAFKQDKKAKEEKIKSNSEKVASAADIFPPAQPIMFGDQIQKGNQFFDLQKAAQKIGGNKLSDKDYLLQEEQKALNYINTKPIDYTLIESKYNDEINNSQFIDDIREGVKNNLNANILTPISVIGQELGFDIDLTFKPFVPLKTEKEQAYKNIISKKKKGEKITKAEVDEEAKKIFYENEILKQKGKAAEEYWDEQPLYIAEVAKLKEDLKIKAAQDALVSSDLARQQTILAKTYSSEIDQYNKYFETFKQKYESKDLTEEEVAEYLDKTAKIQETDKLLKSIYDRFPNYINDLQTDQEKLDYFRYNYNDIENSIASTVGTLVKSGGGAFKILGETLEGIEGDKSGLGGLLNEVGEANIKFGERLVQDIKPMSFDDVSTFSDFGKYIAKLTAEQLPIYASMYFGGNLGAAFVSLGAGGQKIQEMEDEIGSNYDLGTKLLAGYGFALAEFVPEKLGTLRMIDNIKSTMSATSKESRQLFKQSFIKSTLSTAGLIGFESQIEGGTEVITEALDILIDEHLLNKKVTAPERAKRFKEAYIGGAFMGGSVQFGGAASILVAKELRSYATNQELLASRTIVDRLDFLQSELQNNNKLTAEEKVQIASEMKSLSNEAMSIIENSQDRIYDMSSEDMTSVLEINSKQQTLREEYDKLLNSNFSKEIKVEKINELKTQFKELEDKREFLLTGQYAMANKIISNKAVINSSAENIKKIANTLGKKDIANKIGDQEGIAVFSEVKDLKEAYTKWLLSENKTNSQYNQQNPEAKQREVLTPEQIGQRVEEASKADGFYLPNDQIVINLAVASRTGAINVAQHEFLHKVLRDAFKNTAELKKTVNDFLSVLTTKERTVVQKRINDNYLDPTTGTLADENLEEYFTAFIDAIAAGDIGGKNQIKDILRRAAKPFLKLLQKLGWSNAKFSDGREFYDFLKDYQSNASKGRISKRAQALLNGESLPRAIRYSKSIEERMDELDQQLSNNEIDYDTYDKKMEALEKEEAEMKRKEYEEKKAAAKAPEKKAEAKPVEKKPTKQKEPSEISTAAEKAKAKLDAIGNDPKGFNPNNPVIYEELEKMVKAKSRNWKTAKGTIIDFTNKDKGGLDGFDIDEMASYVMASMIPYIKKFDPSKNNSLYGYINSQYINRMKAALKSGQVANVVFTEDVTEMKKLSEEDVEVTKPSLPERKRFQNILESGVFAPEVIDEIQKKIIPIVRTLKTKIDEKVSINRTVAPIIDEIRLAMGSQADIDIKKAMGGKEGGMLTKWLLTNKKTILENMTTTWLMGKDGKGGMPFAIQKRINGQWVNYPDWVGKKIDRESVDVDLAGRTAGHEMVRRLPNVNNNVDNDTFLSAIVDIKDGTPLRGRKEALAKAMAEELAFDLISDDFANEGQIFQAFQRNQEMLGAALEKVTKEEVNRLAERGNIKYSLSAEYAAALEDVKAYDRLSKEEKSKLLDPYSDPKSSISKVIAKIYNELNDDDPEAIKLRTNWDNLIRSKKGLYWKLHEAVIGNRLKRYNNYSVMNYGGNNPNVADVVIAKTQKIARKVNKVFVEIKKAADTLIPITSATANVVIDKFANKETFDKLSEKSQNAVKKIKELQNGLKDNFKLSNLTEFTKTENAKLTTEDLAQVKDILGGKRKKVESLPIGIDLVKLFNNKKYHPNDIIIIRERAFDYFNGYIGFDTFENVFKNFNIDNLENNLFVLNVEYQINTSGNLTIRTYLNFNEAIKTADGKIVNAIDVINNHVKEYGSNSNAFTDENIEKVLSKKSSGMYSKSLENNLNSFKGINNIDLISKYISENNIKRISAEDSFDILNDLAKEIENYWGVLPDNIITMMNRTVDYAFDVIEDRENEGGPLMAALNNALNLETIKNAETQLNQFIDNNKPKTGPKFSKSLDYDFNDMLERNKGIASYEKVSDIVAKRKGAKIRNFSFFIPPSAEDFRGLTTYTFSGKGKQGELDQQFFDNNLVIPYVKGINALDSVRQSIKRAYKGLLDDFPDIKKRLEKATPDKDFTYDQAIRVYLWNKNNIEVPGLSRRDKNKLVYLVKSDGDLLAFAEALSLAGRQDGGWMDPSDTWDSETIISDLHNITEGAGRKKWLAEFIENADAIFSKENLNKIQSIYGTSLRVAIEDSLYRMKNGKNRPEGADRLTNAWMNWINGATSTIMFFNTRSALLQTISSTNFLNWTDNNPLKAAMAFADQKQYWADFAMIINSDKLKERRAGLKSDVSQAEIANAANSAKNKVAGVISYLQKIGFTPTQAADSFAISIGGAAFYRNRLNTYLKQADEDGNLINTQKEAEAKAWTDFSKIVDESQQSADPMYISKQQTTSLGRLVLAFANTPMQYNRIIKKAALDLVNKRGDWKTNMSKIIYYGALQNIIFSALQAALFLPFDDEDEEAIAKMTKEERKEYDKLVEKQNNKAINIANGMLDTVLRGSGITGAVIATLKNIAMEYKKQEDRKHFADHAQTFLAGAGIMPPVSSKLRKAYNIHRTNKFDKDVIEEMGWGVTREGRLNLSPKYSMVGNAVSVATNIPLDRLVEKTENVAEALDSRNSAIQRVALFLGWKEWELNVKNEEQLEIKKVAKAKRKEEGIEKAIETRRKKKEAKEVAYKAMSMEEKREYNRQLIKEKIAKKKKKIEEKKKEALEKRKKRRMG